MKAWPLLILLIACSQTAPEGNIESWKEEIVQTEKAFNDMARKEGIPKAFAYYAAEESAIKRDGKLILGNQAIADWYENDYREGDVLTWEPGFVDVSRSGDLGYTYGPFTFTYPDSLGNTKKSTGYFHTVWKRQEDGNWKFVWD
ncbi:MAG: DUF4440 domain-containing protein [Cyclobacteriaceae bacterium]